MYSLDGAADRVSASVGTLEITEAPRSSPTKILHILEFLYHTLIRGRKMGGDIITTLDGQVWKVALVTEAWPDC